MTRDTAIFLAGFLIVSLLGRALMRAKGWVTVMFLVFVGGAASFAFHRFAPFAPTYAYFGAALALVCLAAPAVRKFRLGLTARKHAVATTA